MSKNTMVLFLAAVHFFSLSLLHTGNATKTDTTQAIVYICHRRKTPALSPKLSFDLSWEKGEKGSVWFEVLWTLWFIILKGSKQCRKWSTAGAGGDLGGGGSVDLFLKTFVLCSSALNCKTHFDFETQREIDVCVKSHHTVIQVPMFINWLRRIWATRASQKSI